MNRFLLLVTAALPAIFLLPVSASANGPPPSPYNINILVFGYPDIDKLYIWGYDQGGVF